MSGDIKKINQTVATFMLTSLALSGIAFAGVNENLIAGATDIQSIGQNSSSPVEMYGVPVEMYGVPVARPMPQLLYGVPVARPVLQPLYGVPTPPPAVVEPMPQLLYGVPVKPDSNAPVNINNIPVMKPENIPVKNQELVINNQPVKKRGSNSNTPVNYVAPVFIPAYYIMKDFK